jgi:sugar lactone lactonase YvrE
MVESGSGGRQAKIVISSKEGSLSEPTGIAFDSQHRLWIANAGNETIVRFDQDQLTSSGAPSPSIVIHAPASPTALAFDATGSLWVSNNTTNKVFSYTPEQLTASGVLVPNVVISANGTSFRNPAGIAFDASGNLWVANPSNTTVVGFSPQQLATSGSPAPQVVLHLTADPLTAPSGLAFDSDGSLWVLGSQNQLQKFSSAALGATGNPSPSVSLRLNNYVILWSLAFWPTPAGSPIN